MLSKSRYRDCFLRRRAGDGRCAGLFAHVIDRGFPSAQVYKQKVKHLLYEHQNQISELKSDGSCVPCEPYGVYT